MASLVVDGSITDPDGSAIEAILVTGVGIGTPEHPFGTWQFSRNDGTTWETLYPQVIGGGTPLEPTDRIRFVPSGTSSGEASITFAAWDRTGYYAPLDSYSIPVSSTAVGLERDTASIAVLGANSAPTFGPADIGGVVTMPFGGSVRMLALHADGTIAGVGSYGSNVFNDAVNGDAYLFRLQPDGSRDPGFGDDGMAIVPLGSGRDFGNGFALQPDGSYVIAGQAARNLSIDDMGLARCYADGTLDASFDGDGRLTLAFGTRTARAYTVAVQSDGKIVAVGTARMAAGDNDFAIARFNVDGTLDTSFDGDGKVTSSFGSPSSTLDAARDIEIIDGGKLLVAGTLGYPFASEFWPGFAVARYNADGSLDTSFGQAGLAILPVSAEGGRMARMVVQADGKIVLAGTDDPYGAGAFTLVRFNADGSPDTSFGGASVKTDVGFADGYLADVALQADGKIVVVGGAAYSSDENEWDEWDVVMVRYNADGSLDGSFGAGGIVVTDLGRDPAGFSDDYAGAVTVQPDGHILVGGGSYNGHSYDTLVLRYTANGQLDSTFGGEPAAVFEIGAGPVLVDVNATVWDAQLSSWSAGAGNYAGASLTLERAGGADATDEFAARVGGTLGALGEGTGLVVAGTVIGTVAANSAGRLVLQFSEGATQSLVDEAVRQIAYSNAQPVQGQEVSIAWTFNDGNADAQGSGGALTAQKTTVVRIADAVGNIVGTAAYDVLSGSPASEQMDGGAGIDAVVFAGMRAAYSLAKTSSGWQTAGGDSGIDTLVNIERLHFSNVRLALDLDGHAGEVAKILGAVFGASALADPGFVGIGLDLADGGLSYELLMSLALQHALGNGVNSSKAVVDLLWANVIGGAPDAVSEQFYMNFIDGGGYTAATLGTMAADTLYNLAHIGFTGLQQTGLEYA